MSATRCKAYSVQWWAQSRDQSRDWFMFATLQRVAELLLSISTKLESESLLCDMYEALNNVRIMSRASHKDTDKRRVNQINKNLKLKSEIYQDAKTIYTEERKALDSIKSRLVSRTCVSVKDWARS